MGRKYKEVNSEKREQELQAHILLATPLHPAAYY